MRTVWLLVTWLFVSACPEAPKAKAPNGITRTDAGEFCDFTKTDYR